MNILLRHVVIGCGALALFLPPALSAQGENQPPGVSSASATVRIGTTQGSVSAVASDPEGGALTYEWSYVSGPGVTFSQTGIPTGNIFTTDDVPEFGDPRITLNIAVTDDMGQITTLDVLVELLPAFVGDAPAQGNGEYPSAWGCALADGKSDQWPMAVAAAFAAACGILSLRAGRARGASYPRTTP